MNNGLCESIDQILVKCKPESDEFVLCTNIIRTFVMFDNTRDKINARGNIPRILAEAMKNK